MGQGTVGLEIARDWPDVDVIVVPIGGGGLISGISLAAKSINPRVRIVGVESSGAPGMQRSVAEGSLVTLDRVDCIIDGLRVKRVGEKTFEIVRQYVDDIVTLPDEKIFEAVLWTMHYMQGGAGGRGGRAGRGAPGRPRARAGRVAASSRS